MFDFDLNVTIQLFLKGSAATSVLMSSKDSMLEFLHINYSVI